MADEVEGADPEPESTSVPDAPAAPESTSEPEPEAESEGSTPPAEPAGDAESEEWRNLSKKFAHIQDERQRQAAIAKAYWQSTNGASKLAKENADLKRRLQAASQPRQPAEPVKPAEPPPPPPDILRVDERIKTFTERREARVKELDAVRHEATQAYEDYITAKTLLERADEVDKPGYQSQLRAIMAERRSLKERHERLTEGLEGIDAELERLKHDRVGVERFLESEKARQEQAEEERERVHREFPDEVGGYITQAASDLKLPETKETRDYLDDLVKDQVTVALWRLQGQDVDYSEVSKEYATAFVKQFHDEVQRVARAMFGKTSQEKLRVTQPVGHTAAPAGTRPPANASATDEEGYDPKLKAQRESARKRLAELGM